MKRICLADPSHIPELLRLLVQVNMVHHRGRPDLFKGPTTKYDAAELAALISDPAHRIFVCEEENTLLGYAMCELEETKESRLLKPLKTLYIDDICVDETCRHQGIGRLLYERTVQEATVLSCDRITLNVWALNPGAARFYESLGLKPLKTTMEMLLPSSGES